MLLCVVNAHNILLILLPGIGEDKKVVVNTIVVVVVLVGVCVCVRVCMRTCEATCLCVRSIGMRMRERMMNMYAGGGGGRRGGGEHISMRT